MLSNPQWRQAYRCSCTIVELLSAQQQKILLVSWHVLIQYSVHLSFSHNLICEQELLNRNRKLFALQRWWAFQDIRLWAKSIEKHASLEGTVQLITIGSFCICGLDLFLDQVRGSVCFEDGRYHFTEHAAWSCDVVWGATGAISQINLPGNRQQRRNGRVKAIKALWWRFSLLCENKDPTSARMAMIYAIKHSREGQNSRYWHRHIEG